MASGTTSSSQTGRLVDDTNWYLYLFTVPNRSIRVPANLFCKGYVLGAGCAKSDQYDVTGLDLTHRDVASPRTGQTALAPASLVLDVIG
jgi:hypothetical protein